MMSLFYRINVCFFLCCRPLPFACGVNACRSPAEKLYYSSALCRLIARGALPFNGAWIRACVCDFHDIIIIIITFPWSEPFDLARVGPDFGIGSPPPLFAPLSLGMALSTLLSDRWQQLASRTEPLAHIHRQCLSSSTRGIRADNLTSFGQNELLSS